MKINNPFFYRLYLLFLRLRKKLYPIRGKSNIIINKALYSKITYDIIGDNNYIEIKKGAILYDAVIYVRGNNHKLIIGEGCLFQESQFWFEGVSNLIEIGGNTTIESAKLMAVETA